MPHEPDTEGSPQPFPPTPTRRIASGLDGTLEPSRDTTIYDGDDGVASPDPRLGASAARSVSGGSGCPCCGCACCRCCGTYKYAMLVGVLVVFTSLPSILTQPIMPDIKRDYFGSDRKAGFVQSMVDCGVALLNTLFAVFYGRIMDAIGRKPFFVAQTGLGVVCFALLMVFPTNPVPFMAASAVRNLIQGSYMQAWLSDMSTADKRATFFAIAQAISTAVLLFALFVALLDVANEVFFGMALASSVVALLFAIFVLPESLPPERRQPLSTAGMRNPFAGITILCKSRILLLSTGIIAIVAIADVGVGEVYMFYLNDRVGFGKKDRAFLFVEISVLAPIALVGVMPLMLRWLSPPFVLTTAVVANAAVMIIIATIWAKWPIFAFAAPVAALMQMAGPIMQTVITNAGDPADIAKRLTAMAAVGDLCQAIGPLVFGLMYGTLKGALATIPFFVSSGLCLVAAGLATLLTPAMRHDEAHAEEISVSRHQSFAAPAVTSSERMLNASLNGRDDDYHAAYHARSNPHMTGGAAAPGPARRLSMDDERPAANDRSRLLRDE